MQIKKYEKIKKDFNQVFIILKIIFPPNFSKFFFCGPGPLFLIIVEHVFYVNQKYKSNKKTSCKEGFQ